MKIIMVGTGYVGLVSGACFADMGHRVVCVDNDPDKIASLRRGKPPIFERNLETLIDVNVRGGRLSFSTDLPLAMEGADAVFICVGTPGHPGSGESDLRFVFAVAREIAHAAKGPLVVVTKSTVPVGTGDRVSQILSDLRSDVQFRVVSNPEFLREGNAIADFMRPDRVVVGVDDASARDLMGRIYQPIGEAGAKILFTSRRSAELMKYAANMFLAMKITFINEIADLCEKVEADVTDIAVGIGLDSRIGSKFLQPGPGFGGSCFPKDVTALIQTSQYSGTDLRLLEAVAVANPRRKRNMGRKIISACGGDVRNKTIAVLGLTFKADTDDMREAPSLVIIPALQEAGAHIRAYDPLGKDKASKLLSDVEYAGNAYECADGADAVVVMTEWSEFRSLDLARLKSCMKTPTAVDLRNIWKPSVMRELGFTYSSIGRP